MTNPHRRILLAFALASGACASDNQAGHVASEGTGDLSHPLAERDSPAEAEADACGDADMLPGFEPAVRRAPYMQRVTDTGARVLWTSDEGAPEVVAMWPGEPEEGALTEPTAAETGVMDGAEPAPGVLQYRSELDQLSPDTIYCYSLELEGEPATTPTGFRTAPAPGSQEKVTFAAFGDSGEAGDDQYAVLAQLQTVPMRLMIHTGDIAYEDGTMKQFEETYFDIYRPILDSIAMFPSIGNHDDHENYRKVYDLPWAQSGKSWYSFDYGNIHFVALDSTDLGDEQARWLDRDLADNRLGWTVVYGHHPAFSSGEHGNTSAMQDLFVPIFEKHHVDLVLAGHDHDYERMIPQNGVNYVVTGGGGRGTRPVGSSDFTAYAEDVLHFVYVEVEGNQLLLHAIDGVGVEFDQLAITH
jgi:hypothetical protein